MKIGKSATLFHITMNVNIQHNMKLGSKFFFFEKLTLMWKWHKPNESSMATTSRCSIVVSIPAYHAGDPGSIPGNGAIDLTFALIAWVLNASYL